jgi:hypothetical protein
VGFEFILQNFFSWGRIIESCIEKISLHLPFTSPTNHLWTPIWLTHKPSLLHDLDATRLFSLRENYEFNLKNWRWMFSSLLLFRGFINCLKIFKRGLFVFVLKHVSLSGFGFVHVISMLQTSEFPCRKIYLMVLLTIDRGRKRRNGDKYKHHVL